MNYFQPYSLPADQTVLAAWDSQLCELADCPALVNAFAKQPEMFPRFAESYAKLRALPRGTRRALQRKLARARELVSLQPEWQKKLAASLAGAALLLALAQSASAATIAVTTNVPDINDGDGKCSLIEAIVNANNDAATHPDCVAGDGADTIVLPKNSTITLAKYYTYDYGTMSYGYTGLPIINSSIVIEGNGTNITRKDAADPFRLISVSNSGDLALKNLSLTGGSVVSEYYSTGFFGGAIFNYGIVAVLNSKISGNEVPGGGGGIYNYANATLVVENSEVSGNTAKGYYNGSFPSCGGGISNAGILTVRNSVISNNTAGVGNDPRGDAYPNFGMGGGICNVYYGTAAIENSQISGNTTGWGDGPGFGGAIYSGPQGSFAIKNSNIFGNTGYSAIYNAGYISYIYVGGRFTGPYFHYGLLTVENSFIFSNSAGGIYNGGTANVISTAISGNLAVGGGGGINNSGQLTIDSSMIVGNTARASDYTHGYGGGINNGGTLRIINSTISNNIAKGSDRYGNSPIGGGIANQGELHVIHTTITANTVVDGFGGGIDDRFSGQVTLQHSLISGNKGAHGSEVSLSNVYGGNIHADDFNIFGSNGNSGVEGFTPGPSDIVPNVPLKKILASPRNNGGPTLTHALVKGSPAIDAAPIDADCPATDQRGVARPQGVGCDIGAVEYTGKTSGGKNSK